MVKLAKNIAMLTGKACYVGGKICRLAESLAMLEERADLPNLCRVPYFLTF
jgi:hypothetical protein